MGQRVITFLNHLDFKKNKNNNNANKKGEKNTRGIIFLVKEKNTRGEEQRKK